MASIDESLTNWSTDDRAGKPLLVLLHGYGADENDLFGLVPYFPDAIAVAAVAAPVTPPWPMPGRSWYPIEGLGGRDSSAVNSGAEAFVEWLEAHAGDAPTIALLGFSQGGAIALQTLRMLPDRIKAVVNLSGYAALGEMPRDAELRELRTPVFWGRGAADDVIPEELIAGTAQWLPEHSELSGRMYPGLTHSISEAELADVRAFLDTWVEASNGDE